MNHGFGSVDPNRDCSCCAHVLMRWLSWGRRLRWWAPGAWKMLSDGEAKLLVITSGGGALTWGWWSEWLRGEVDILVGEDRCWKIASKGTAVVDLTAEQRWPWNYGEGWMRVLKTERWRWVKLMELWNFFFFLLDAGMLLWGGREGDYFFFPKKAN